MPGLPSVLIDNDGGGASNGSVTSFTGLSSTAGLGTLMIHGNLEIDNGTAPFGAATNMVTFNAVNVLGHTFINNANSDTKTIVLGSTLGSEVTPLPAVDAAGGQVLVTNKIGFDTFSMDKNTFGQNSSIPWGLGIDNGAAANLSGSQTSITNSSVGMAGFLPGRGVLAPGTAFKLDLDNGLVNTQTITAAMFGGAVNIDPSNGPVSTTITGSSMPELDILLGTAPGSGPDTVVIDSTTISNKVHIQLSAAEHDHLTIAHVNYANWPSPLTGGVVILDGGPGLSDEFTQTADTGTLPAGTINNFEIFD
jgi:hypothetical protein